MGAHFAAARLRIVLGPLDGGDERPLAARQDHPCKVGADTVGRRQLRSVEQGDAATGAGADIDQPSPRGQPGDDAVDCAHDRSALGGDRRGDCGVLFLDAPHQLVGGQQIEVATGREPLGGKGVGLHDALGGF